VFFDAVCEDFLFLIFSSLFSNRLFVIDKALLFSFLMRWYRRMSYVF